MTAYRACMLLFAFTLIALAAVYLRTEQTRAAARALAAELHRVEVRRELWDVQASVARLRAPEEIRTRVTRFDEELLPPTADGADTSVGELALSHAE